MILKELEGKDVAVVKLIADLIRDTVCGATQVQCVVVVPGSLRLPLLEPAVDLSSLKGTLASSALLQLQFVQWLRMKPKVTQLSVSGQHLGARGANFLRQALEDGALPQIHDIQVSDDPRKDLDGLVELIHAGQLKRLRYHQQHSSRIGQVREVVEQKQQGKMLLHRLPRLVIQQSRGKATASSYAAADSIHVDTHESSASEDVACIEPVSRRSSHADL